MAYTRRQELMCTEAQMIAKPNVVLRENEVIYIKMNDGTLRQKIGDGVTTIINLPFTQVFDGSVVQNTGDSTTAVMSQKATTDMGMAAYSGQQELKVIHGSVWSLSNGSISLNNNPRRAYIDKFIVLGDSIVRLQADSGYQYGILAENPVTGECFNYLSSVWTTDGVELTKGFYYYISIRNDSIDAESFANGLVNVSVNVKSKMMERLAGAEETIAEHQEAIEGINATNESLSAEIETVEAEIGNIKGISFEETELNYFDSTNLDSELSNAARARTGIFKIPKNSRVSISDANYDYVLCRQTFADGVQTTVTVNSTWRSSGLFVGGSPDANYRVMIRRSDKGAISESELENLHIVVESIEKEYELFSTEKNNLIQRVLNDVDSNTFVFLWSSDNHYNETVRSGVCQVQYAKEMSEIANDIGATCIVNTGDIIASDHDDTGETPDLNVNRSRMKDIVGGFITHRLPFLYAFGHHEVYPFVEMVNGESTYAIDKSIICKIGHQPMRLRSYTVYQDDDRSKPNFYTDDNTNKIRMIFLDGTSVLAVGYSYNTIKFLESALASVPSGYSVICFSHTPTRESAVGRRVNGGNYALSGDYLPSDVDYNNETIESVIEAFISGGGNFIGFFHGHTHCDNVVKDEGMNFSLISIACQMVASATGEGITSNENLVAYNGRNEYYYNAYCFDIVCVHKNTRTIKLFRFGVGNDRTITY